MSSHFRTIVTNIVVMLCTTALVIAVLELGLRITGIERMESRRPHLHQQSDISGVNYSFVPNLKNERGYNWERVSTNSLGFRGPELEPAKPDIAIVGDSFAFGFGLNDDETQDAHLRKAFPEYNVVNMGVNGYNIEQEARAFIARPKHIDPKLLIVEFVFNDMAAPSMLTDEEHVRVFPVDEYARQDSERIAELEKSVTKPGTLQFPLKGWLQTHSAVFTFLEKRTKWLPFRARAVNNFSEVLTERDWAFYETWFSRLTSAAPEAKKILVIWPENRLNLQTRHFLYDLANRQGYMVLDLYDVFGMRYPALSWDWHPNAKAQKTAADLLIEIIRHYRLLDGQP